MKVIFHWETNVRTRSGINPSHIRKNVCLLYTAEFIYPMIELKSLSNEPLPSLLHLQSVLGLPFDCVPVAQSKPIY